MSEETPVVPQSTFPGEAFIGARESLGLGLDKVARQLHLSENVVRYIEQSELDRLADPVFARGYVRAYARFLKLDADAMVAAYNHQTGNLDSTGQVRTIGTLSTAPGRRPGHPLLKIGSWLFMLALIAASIWWWQAQFGFDFNKRAAGDDLPVSVETTDGTTLILPQLSDVEPDVVQPSVSKDAVVDDLLVEPLHDADVQASADKPGDVVVPIDEMSSAKHTAELSDSAAEPESLSGTASEPVVVKRELDLNFTDDCWLSVKDAQGRTLFSGVAKSGSSLVLDGDEPLALVVGRVSAVASIRYADKPIDLAAISKDNVARLKLPL